MSDHYKLAEKKEVIHLLQKLPEEDRILLGLFLYEKLSHDQVQIILNHKTQPLNQHSIKSKTTY